jgi:hypothetical protein
VRPDARPQALKNWKRIHWDRLRIFRAENEANGRRSFAAVERSMPDRLLGNRACHRRTYTRIAQEQPRGTGSEQAADHPTS